MAVHSGDFSAVAASITSPVAELRKSASSTEPAAVQFRSLVVRSVAGRYRERGAGKQQYPVAAGNPVPASKQEVTVTDKVSAQASFSSGAKGSAGTWEVENPSSNSVVMQCEIVLDGKSIAESAPIYPGQHIDGLTLSCQVPSGNYSVTATIRYYSKDTKAYLGMVDYKIHLSVS